jgi:phosphate transport system protein
MPRHLQREIDKLKKKVLALGALVEERVRMAVRAIEERDGGLAAKVIDGDVEVDQAEVDLEEDCLKVLALHQPVAIDLRYIVAILKMNSDLERIGDLAVNIAERAQFLSTQVRITYPFDLQGLVEKSQWMLRSSLDAMVNLDSGLARESRRADNEVDDINRNMYDLVKKAIQKNPEDLEMLIPLLSVSRYLEQIADHATNIAEDIIYMNEGIIARHKGESLENKPGPRGR